MIIYIGNLSPDTTRDDLRLAFEPHGEVSSVSLLTEQMKGGHGIGPSRGFGFVIMPNKGQAQEAMVALNLQEIRGRPMTVQVARPIHARSYRR